MEGHASLEVDGRAELDVEVKLALDGVLAIDPNAVASSVHAVGRVRGPLVRRRDGELVDVDLDATQAAVLGEVLVVHDFQDGSVVDRVDRDVDVLIPLGVEVWWKPEQSVHCGGVQAAE